MSNNDQDKAIQQYVSNFEWPAEKHILNNKAWSVFNSEKKKLEATVQFAESALKNLNIAEKFEKTVLGGEIYSAGEAARVVERINAIEGDGVRIDLKRSVVSPTGEVIIMSEGFASVLGFTSDNYFTQEDLEQACNILRTEQISDSLIEKVRQAMMHNGAVMVQRGAFAALKDLLQESSPLSMVSASFENFKRGPEAVSPYNANEHGASINALKDRLVPIAPRPVGPRMTTAEINRELNTKEIPSRPIEAVATAPAPQPAQVRFTPPPKPESMKLSSVPTLGLPSLMDIKVMDDLKKIEPAHLRQAYLPEQIKLIRSKIAYLSGINKTLPVNAVNAFEESPLFRLYLKIGSAILSLGTKDRKPDYREVVTSMVRDGQEVLSLAEFEAVADLRKELELM